MRNSWFTGTFNFWYFIYYRFYQLCLEKPPHIGKHILLTVIWWLTSCHRMEGHIGFMREWEGGDNRLPGQWRKTEREGEVSLEEEWEDVKKIEPEMKNWTRDGWKDTDKEGETEEESIERVLVRPERESERGGGKLEWDVLLIGCRVWQSLLMFSGESLPHHGMLTPPNTLTNTHTNACESWWMSVIVH